MIVHNQTLVAEAQRDLLAQFQNSPNLNGLVAALVQQAQDLEDATNQLLTQTSLDTAIGAQLDVIGEILSLDRGSLTDEEYRADLRIRVLIITSSGTADDILNVLIARYGFGLFRWTIKDGVTAEFDITLNDSSIAMTPVEAEVMANYISAVKAAGVRFLLSYPPSNAVDGQYFSFGSMPDAEGDSFGFDDGAFSGVIEG